VSVSPTDWLSDDFFKVEKLKSVAMSAKDPAFNWRLYRESEADTEWKLAGLKEEEGEELDAARISSIRNAFSNARFDDVVLDEETAGDEMTKFVLQTFEGFVYTVEVGPELGPDRKHLLTVRVKAVLPEKRDAEEGETEEDKKANDEVFAMERERLEKKLEAEKALEGHVYLVPNFVVSSLLKRRFELLKVEDETPNPAGGGAPGPAGGMPFPGAGGLQGFPGAGMDSLIQRPPEPTSPTPAPAKARATAVTPPVGIENGKIMSADEIKKRADEATKMLQESADSAKNAKKAGGATEGAAKGKKAPVKEGKGAKKVDLPEGDEGAAGNSEGE
jgi:hypothetical protein